jgi:hypothetical protein
VLLLAALVAVPVLLSKDPEPAPLGTSLPSALQNVKPADAAVTGQPIVAIADESTARRRRVLGARKDPFAPAPAPKAKAADVTPDTKPTSTPTGSAGGGASVGGGSAPSGGSGGGSAPATPAPAKRRYPANSLTVRFGASSDTSSSLDKLVVRTLEPLVGSEQPLLVYLGMRKNGKEAEFLVDESIVAQGDGRCSGSSACETLRLSVGETEFLDVVDEDGNVTAQYQLDLVAIHAKKSAGGANSAKARKAATARRVKLAQGAMQRNLSAEAMARLFGEVSSPTGP